MRTPLIVIGLLGLIAFSLVKYFDRNPACVAGSGMQICAASDMARVTRTGEMPRETEEYFIRDQALSLRAARNEVIAFQLLVKNLTPDLGDQFQLVISDLRSDDATTLSADNAQLFQAHYHYVDQGGYDWGPTSEVLPWPDHYPDALIPQTMQCGSQTTHVLDAFTLPENKQENQSIWLDWYIPRDQVAGLYKGQIQITRVDQAENPITIPFELTVGALTLPDKTHIQAVGEIYDPYIAEGVGKDMRSAEWQAMAQCYQQLAHQHRIVFIERLHINNDDEARWQAYRDYVDPILTGELFTEKYAYQGPGFAEPVNTWRTPWAQGYNARVHKPLSDAEIEKYRSLAEKWQTEVDKNQWHHSTFFAYVFDEVDGATDTDELGDVPPDYISMVHTQMDRVQKAIDRGTGDQSVDLIWTSHTDPGTWANNPKEDLAGITRLWSPSANSANVDFLHEQKAKGDTIWFYHAGHPSVGVHSVNASGIEMRSWGLITARYDFDGHFMWAINLADPKLPYHYPSYKRDDDRFGNGAIVYPGNQLNTIGYHATPGPIPSMRLKAWRRGLQDAELVKLAAQNSPQRVSEGLQSLIPDALSKGKKKASWSQSVEDWIGFRNYLLDQE